jgi:hypothetical protein
MKTRHVITAMFLGLGLLTLTGGQAFSSDPPLVKPPVKKEPNVVQPVLPKTGGKPGTQTPAKPGTKPGTQTPGVIFLTERECKDLGGELETDSSCPEVRERFGGEGDRPYATRVSRTRCRMKDGKSSCITE